MNMSFALTTQAMYNFQKTCTRRYGWDHVHPAQIIWAVEKGMGLKKGEKIKRIHEIQVLHNRWEPADRMIREPKYGELEVVKEGFPHMRPVEFVEMLCDHNKKLPNEPVNRIEFRFLLRKAEFLFDNLRISPKQFGYDEFGTMFAECQETFLRNWAKEKFRFEFE